MQTQTTCAQTEQTELQYTLLSYLIFASFSAFTGIFCGSVPPGPVLLNNSQNATLLFSSDINRAGSGFVVRHRALQGRSDPGGRHNIQYKHKDTVQHTATHISASYTQVCTVQCARLIYRPNRTCSIQTHCV